MSRCLWSFLLATLIAIPACGGGAGGDGGSGGPSGSNLSSEELETFFEFVLLEVVSTTSIAIALDLTLGEASFDRNGAGSCTRTKNVSGNPMTEFAVVFDFDPCSVQFSDISGPLTYAGDGLTVIGGEDVRRSTGTVSASFTNDWRPDVRPGSLGNSCSVAGTWDLQFDADPQTQEEFDAAYSGTFDVNITCGSETMNFVFDPLE